MKLKALKKVGVYSIHPRNEKGVSEILGTVLLLAISVALFSALYLMMQTGLVAEQSPVADLIGYVNQDTIYIEHQGGSSLSETTITITLDGEEYVLDFNESFDENNNGNWNIGEHVYFTNSQISELSTIKVSVVDTSINELIYGGVLSGEGDIQSNSNGNEQDENAEHIVAWWHFDEESGSIAYDETENNNDAVLSGTRWTAGINQSGILFDKKQDELSADSSQSLSITENLSISLWSYFYEFPKKSENIIFSYGANSESEGTNTLYELSINSDGDLTYVHEYDNGINQDHIFSAGLSENTWYNIVIIRNSFSRTVSLYINDEFIESFSYTHNPTGGASSSLYLGSYKTGNKDPIDGILDEIIIFNNVQSIDDIQKLNDFT